MSRAAERAARRPPSADTLTPASTGRRGFASSSVASHTSTGSLSTSFVHLDKRQLSFFDHVIALLPDGAHEFAELKRAYNRACIDHRPVDDTTLWDSLLRLTHIRGRTWVERWAAVLTSLGHEPRIVSEDSGFESMPSDDGEHQTPRLARREKHHAQSWQARATKEPQSSASLGRRLQTRQDGALSVGQTTHAIGGTQKQNDRVAEKQEAEALRAQMAALQLEVSSLTNSIDRAPPFSTVRPSILVSARDRDRVSKDRKLRFASSSDQFEISKATTVESASEDDAFHSAALLSTRRETQRRPPQQVGSSTPAKRRFEEVVARSRSERDAGRRAEETRREAEEEAQRAPLRQDADRFLRAILTRKSLSWWMTVHRRRDEQQEAALAHRDAQLKVKAILAWHKHAVRRRGHARHADTIDTIRCRLRAWRTWQRRVTEKRKKAREGRRMELRGAFEVTCSRVEHRSMSTFYQRWRIALMERRASNFRSDHLLRGAMGMWRIQTWNSAKLQTSEEVIRQRRDATLLRLAWQRMEIAFQTREQNVIASSYDRHQTLQKHMVQWQDALHEQRAARRREALADRWHNRRLKTRLWHVWNEKTQDTQAMQKQADILRSARVEGQKARLFALWVLRERERLYHRIAAERTLVTFFGRLQVRYEALMESLADRERRIAMRRSTSVLFVTFNSWRETARKSVSAQRMAAQRDGRKILGDALKLWKAATQRKDLAWQQARAVDIYVVQRRHFTEWAERRREKKVLELEHVRDREAQRSAFAFWRATTAQKRKEALAVGMLRSKIERRARKRVLDTWTERVVVQRSRFLDAAERSDSGVVQRAWQVWIQACIQHEDMLNLSKSFLDVKREELLRRLFVAWSSAARAERIRRERADHLLRGRARRQLQGVMEQWYDRYAEAMLRDQELDALLQRQAAVKQSVFARWQNRTRSLPAIRLEHARRVSHAFHRWHAALPFAQIRRKAVEQDTLAMQAKAFDHWLRIAKAKRAFRAAARFGGPSAVRLRAAHRRSSGGPAGASSGGGGAFGARGGGFGQTPRRRNQTVAAHNELATPRANERLPLQNNRGLPATALNIADVSSLRESDLVLTEDSTNSSPTKTAAAAAASRRAQSVRALCDDPPTLARLTGAGAPHGRRTPSPVKPSTVTANESPVRSRSQLPSPPPALRRWMQGITQAPASPAASSSRLAMQPDSKSNAGRANSEVSSEPSRGPSPGRRQRLGSLVQRITELDHDGHRGHDEDDSESLDGVRTPSLVSRAQSEATVRIPDSSRLASRVVPVQPSESSSPNTMVDILRARRRRIPG